MAVEPPPLRGLLEVLVQPFAAMRDLEGQQEELCIFKDGLRSPVACNAHKVQHFALQGQDLVSHAPQTFHHGDHDLRA